MTKRDSDDQENASLHKPNPDPESFTEPVTRRCWSESCRKTVIGIVIVAFLAFSWVGAQQFAQSAVQLSTFNAPYFTTWFSTCWVTLCYPVYCLFLILVDRKNIRTQIEESTHIFGQMRVTLRQFLTRICTLNMVWLAVNYMYVYGLKLIAATDASAIMASNVAFVYAFSVCLLHEKIYVIRLLASIFCISGVVLFAYVEGFQGSSTLFMGILLIVGSAVGAAIYKVIFKKLVGDASLGKVSLFLSLLGLSNLFIMWIFFVLLYFTGVEQFTEIPWNILCASSSLSLLFNFLVNFGIAYTYPLFISIAMMLGIPLNAGVDVIFKGVSFSALRLVAALLIIIGFALMLFPDSWNDPIHDVMRCERRNLSASVEAIEEDHCPLNTKKENEEAESDRSSSMN